VTAWVVALGAAQEAATTTTILTLAIAAIRVTILNAKSVVTQIIWPAVLVPL
jgi:hypothetical protein